MSKNEPRWSIIESGSCCRDHLMLSIVYNLIDSLVRYYGKVSYMYHTDVAVLTSLSG